MKASNNGSAKPATADPRRERRSFTCQQNGHKHQLALDTHFPTFHLQVALVFGRHYLRESRPLYRPIGVHRLNREKCES